MITTTNRHLTPAAALIVYDSIITIDQVIILFRNKFTGATLLFLLSRVLGILSAVTQSLPGSPTVSDFLIALYRHQAYGFTDVRELQLLYLKGPDASEQL